MNKHTPSLEEVRDAASLFRSRFFDQDEFDRWLAAHDAQVRQEAKVQALREAANDYYEEADRAASWSTDPWHTRNWFHRRADQLEENK